MRSKVDFLVLITMALALCAFPAIGLFAGDPAPAAPAQEQAQEQQQVTQLVFGKVAEVTAFEQMPDDARELAKAILATPGAVKAHVHYNRETGVLTIELADLAGVVNPLSDCPNNTRR